MKTKKEITINDLAKLLEKLGEKVEKLSVKMDTGFKKNDVRFFSLERKMETGFKNQEKKLEEKFDKKISELALMVAKGFKETASKEEAATKIDIENLNLKIDNVEESLINKIDSAKGDVILIIRKLDEKIIVLVDFLKGHQILNDVEYEKLCKIKAFQTIELKS